MRKFLPVHYRLDHFPLSELPRLTHFGHAREFRSGSGVQKAGLHGHFGYEFKYITRGRFSFILNPKLKPLSLAPGDLLVTAPDLPHQFDTGGKSVDFYWFGLQTGRKIARAARSDFRIQDRLEVLYEEQADLDLESMGGRLTISGFLVLHKFWEGEALLSDVEDEITGRRKYAKQLVHLKILEILTRILRRVEEPPAKEPPGARMKRAEKHLREHLGRSMRLEEVSRVAGMSPAHFSRQFRRDYGASPVAYANALRLERAKTLLGEGENVSRTAAACGFRDPFYFSAFFKSKTGSAPSVYREKG